MKNQNVGHEWISSKSFWICSWFFPTGYNLSRESRRSSCINGSEDIVFGGLPRSFRQKAQPSGQQNAMSSTNYLELERAIQAHTLLDQIRSEMWRNSDIPDDREPRFLRICYETLILREIWGCSLIYWSTNVATGWYCQRALVALHIFF